MRNLFIIAETYREKITPHLNPLPQGERRSGLLKLILLLALALMVSACDKLPQTLTDPTTTVAFSGFSPGSNSVYMAQNTSLSSGNTLAIDIKTKNVSGVFGAAFDVDFDFSEMTYDDYVSGTFLETGGNTITYQIGLQSNNSSKVVVGISRQAGATGVSGSGTLVTLKFKATGNSTVDFSNNELRDYSNQTISGISWYGGAVTVQ